MRNAKKLLNAFQSQPDFMKDKVGKHCIPNCKAMYYIALPNFVLRYRAA